MQSSKKLCSLCTNNNSEHYGYLIHAVRRSMRARTRGSAARCAWARAAPTVCASCASRCGRWHCVSRGPWRPSPTRPRSTPAPTYSVRVTTQHSTFNILNDIQDKNMLDYVANDSGLLWLLKKSARKVNK